MISRDEPKEMSSEQAEYDAQSWLRVATSHIPPEALGTVLGEDQFSHEVDLALRNFLFARGPLTSSRKELYSSSFRGAAMNWRNAKLAEIAKLKAASPTQEETSRSTGAVDCDGTEIFEGDTLEVYSDCGDGTTMVLVGQVHYNSHDMAWELQGITNPRLPDDGWGNRATLICNACTSGEENRRVLASNRPPKQNL